MARFVLFVFLCAPRLAAEPSPGISSCERSASPKHFTDVPMPVDLVSDLGVYFECQAFATRDPRICEDLERITYDVPMPSGAANRCKMRYRKLIVARSYISHAADSMEQCKRHEGDTDPPGQFSPNELDELCSFILATDDPQAICAKSFRLAKEAISARELKSCAEGKGMEKGDGRVCSRVGMTLDEQWNCLGYAAYRKIRASGDPNQCGKLPVCRMLMGEANLCQTLAQRIRTKRCVSRLAPKVSP